MDSLPLRLPALTAPVAPLGIRSPLLSAPAGSSQGKPPAPPPSSPGPSRVKVEMGRRVRGRDASFHPDRLGSKWGGVLISDLGNPITTGDSSSELPGVGVLSLFDRWGN